MLYSAAKYQVINQPISLRMRCSVNGHGLAATSYSNKIKFPESKLAGGTLEDTCFLSFCTTDGVCQRIIYNQRYDARCIN